MKTIIRIAAISGSLFIGGLAHGQDKTAPAAPTTMKQSATAPAPAVKPRVADGWRGLPLGMLIKQVGLTPEQTQKGKELNAKYMKDYQALDANMPLEDRKVKVKAMMDAREEELKAILTPEQTEKYKNMRTPSGEMRGEMKPADPKVQAKPAMTKEAAPVQEKKK